MTSASYRLRRRTALRLAVGLAATGPLLVPISRRPHAQTLDKVSIQTDWRAQNGEIVATPKSADGGWLVLNQSFQDVQLAASVRCAAAQRPCGFTANKPSGRGCCCAHGSRKIWVWKRLLTPCIVRRSISRAFSDGKRDWRFISIGIACVCARHWNGWSGRKPI